MTREEAIICLKGIKNYGRDTFNEQSDWQGCADMAIKALEQEPKIGHWIMVHPLQEDDGGAYLCSECKMGNWENIGEWKYCPNCGAKMESEDKE